MTDADMPPIPVTGPELAARWAQRDAEYAKQRTPLDQQTVAAIRSGRMSEANHLPYVGDRARAVAKAETWAPPVHPEFGGLKDWLIE